MDYNPSVVVDRSFTITCPATGVPEPEMMWFRNGTVLDLLSHPNMQLLDKNMKLRIDNIQVTWMGPTLNINIVELLFFKYLKFKLYL